MGSLKTVLTFLSTLHHQRFGETAKSLDHSALSDKNSSNFKPRHDTALSQKLQKMRDNSHNIIEVTHYKPLRN